jgi:LysM repeat protein
MAVNVIQGSGVSISGAGNDFTSVFFTVTFTNSSSANVQTYEIIEGGGTIVRSGTIPRGGTRTVSFNSGNVYTSGDSGSYSAVRISAAGNPLGTGIVGFAIEFPPSPPPPPATPAPVFSDSTVVAGVLGKSYSDSVTASNTTSYAVAAGGSFPPGLSLNTTTGAITGIPTQQGSFSFVINATGTGGTTGSGNLTIQILPPGNRRNSSDFNSNLAVARRYNGTSWVNLTTMKRFNGTAWVDISN